MLHLAYSLFVVPLMQLYGVLFDAPDNLEVGTRIVVFSVLINLILMPLYNQMERRSRAAQAKRATLARDVERMRRHFTGRERYFYVRAVYRQHRYHPLTHVLASGDLLVQILVFATVFHFLNGLPELRGASFGPLRDLSRPDGLLGGFNLLPLLMTAINILAVISYVGERTRRAQAVALSALFLVLLYSSPSGLVLYWTTNNLYSLIRHLLRRHFENRPKGELGERLGELQRQQ